MAADFRAGPAKLPNNIWAVGGGKGVNLYFRKHETDKASTKSVPHFNICGMMREIRSAFAYPPAKIGKNANMQQRILIDSG